MNRHISLSIRLALKLAVLSILGLPTPGACEPTYSHGVVVEATTAGSALKRAGVQPGDILLSWKRQLTSSDSQAEARGGTIESVFDWMWVEFEEAPRGLLDLQILRGENVLFLTPPLGRWDTKVRPRLPDDLVHDYLAVKEAIANKNLLLAADLYTNMYKKVERTGKGASKAWIWMKIGNCWKLEGQWDKAIDSYRIGIANSDDKVTRSILSELACDILEAKRNPSSAKKCYQRLLRERRQVWGETLFTERANQLIGQVALDEENLEEAEAHIKNSLITLIRLAPDSYLTLASLNNLGIIASKRGDPDTAERYLSKALEISEEIGSPEDTARSFGNLATVFRLRGEFLRAQEYTERELALLREISGPEVSIASNLHDLGTILAERGDLEKADDFLRQALSIKEKIAPDSLSVALTLENLGSIAAVRHDYDVSMLFDLKALDIRRRLKPGGLAEALSLNNLAVNFLETGDAQKAERYHREALAIRRRHAPEGLLVAESLNNLGWVAFSSDKLDEAERYFETALSIRGRLTPNGLDTARTLKGLGEVNLAKGALGKAERLFERALRIQTAICPRSTDEAETLHNLGMVNKNKGSNQEALRYLYSAISSLESQFGRLGGIPEYRSNLMNDHSLCYSNLISLLAQLNMIRDAFEVLERSRAHSFLAMLAERDLTPLSDAPKELFDKANKIAVALDRTYYELSNHTKTDTDEHRKVLTRLRELTLERLEIVNQVRRLSPKLASLRYPKPLTVPESYEALDADTVMLTYSIGEESSYLFVLNSKGALEFHSLDIRADEARRMVRLLRNLLVETTASFGVSSAREDTFKKAAEHLFRILVEPATPEIERSKRILVIPDGPLHTLPWGVLVRPTQKINGPSGVRNWEYLSEWKPVHTALSATVYGELLKSRPTAEGSPNSPPMMVAFGDPIYPRRLDESTESIEDVRVRSIAKRGFAFEPLPFTRTEVEEIAKLYGPSNVSVFLGSQATEQAAKLLSKRKRYVHLAAHGVLDEYFPLNSAVALTMPEQFVEGLDNGLLQAWEILEGMRLDADLVVLSACESGLGKEIGGEGLIGLTRAFQYAGARSVMASLWKISDRTTAEFMVRFYRHLKEGLSKDEALRATQMEFIRGPIQVTNEKGERVDFDASAPYYWAAFQIYGDWQ